MRNGSDVPLPWIHVDMAQIIQELVPNTLIMVRDEPDPYAMNARTMSIAAIERDIGWEPMISIEEGIQSLYDSFFSHTENSNVS